MDALRWSSVPYCLAALVLATPSVVPTRTADEEPPLELATPPEIVNSDMVTSAVAGGPPAAEPKPAADPKVLEAAAKLLARAYGTERATLGPLFGAAKIGRIGSRRWRDPIERAGVPVSRLMGADEEPLPEDAELKIQLWTAGGPPDKNEPSYYFDGADIMLRNAELCTQLGQRLEKLWGPQKEMFWSNPARHQAARFDLTSAPGVSCTLAIFRTATTDAAHCLPDEAPVDSREIDVRHGCLKANRPTTCRLVRYSDLPPEDVDCQADDAHHRFYAGDVPRSVARPRSCTLEELHSLHFSDLQDCDKRCPACAELRRAGILR